MQLSDFWMRHRGETCVVCGVGPNLPLTPPPAFPYPTFGCNTVYKQTLWPGWKPTYFVGVDYRLMVEDGQAICSAYPDMPKFFPAPDWDELDAPNVYRFQHRTGGNLYIGGQKPTDRDMLLKWGINYRRIMDAVFQIAAWMGFTTLLTIGIQHKPGTRKEHFWGTADHDPANEFHWEEDGYQFFARALPVRILNISQDTYVPENVLPRDDWRKYAREAVIA